MASLSGKVVVITGSTRGIGRAMAEECARQGADVVVSSRSSDAVSETVDALKGAGGSAAGIVCDVTREEHLEALWAFAVEQFGRVDVWVNNAGMSLGLRLHVDTTSEEISGIVDTNLTSTMIASRMVVPRMIEQGGGVLINVSGRGARGDAAAYTAAYAATKAGIMAFTRSLAEEHKRDPISVLVFMPGMVDTDFYNESMPVTPGLEPMVENVRIVLDAIGTPIEAVGPKLAECAACEPGTGSGRVHSAGSAVRGMLGGFRLAWARMTGRMKGM